ncbi:hypothetical protein TRVA0_033S00144 [Trichomonascus vanleenenianus]|uniref:uncharacterized protein n=1 Tax=Trichomonascus vanleenenianus TaxID=2268995 RepID=UPI003ECA54DA
MKVPSNWPDTVVYTHKNVYSKRLIKEELDAIGVSRNEGKPGSGPSKLVKIKRISDPNHPACGQFGLFAASKLAPRSKVLDYMGYVHPRSESDDASDYDLVLDKATGVAIDAWKLGCEARMVNDYRGIRNKPNVQFDDYRDSATGELKIAVFVLDQPIQKGEELCINYGKGFWQGRQ